VSDSPRPITRRESLAALATIASLGGTTLDAAEPANRISMENRKPGTRDWMLAKSGVDPDLKRRAQGIEGYVSQRSIAAGQTLAFHVSTKPDSAFTIDVYRMGYYGGDGGRLVHRMGPIDGTQQSTPRAAAKRRMTCEWPAVAELKIPADWLSGVYLGKLTATKSGLQSYVVFIVTDDRKADFLFQCSDNTWQAYNRWPENDSLYDDGKTAWYWGGNVQVGFRRPYAKYFNFLDAPLSLGSGEFLLWEFPFAYWMESRGYDATYIGNGDTHSNPGTLLRAKGFLSVGHDEYWTIEMYRNVRAALDRGVSLGFFSGNAVCGRIVFDETRNHFERVGVFGPPDGTREFQMMKSLKHERPYANELVGAHSTGPVTGGADWVCKLPGHWLYRDTGMKAGDTIPGLIGWEWHGDPAPIKGLEIVSGGPTQEAPGKRNGGQYTATTYPGPSDNFVFNASTIWWADGLSAPPGYVRPKVYTEPKGPDPRVQQMTANVLERMAKTDHR
jgi:hypothetical protein